MDTTITFLISTITGVITFFVGMRRGRAETESVLLQNLEKSINLYQVIIDDMGEQVGALKLKIEKLEVKVEELLEENKKLKEMHRNANTYSKK